MTTQTLRLMRWMTDGLTDLPRLHGTVTLSLDDQALLLSSPTLPAFSTTQPEHVLGPNANTEILLKFSTQYLAGIMISNKVSSKGVFPLR